MGRHGGRPYHDGTVGSEILPCLPSLEMVSVLSRWRGVARNALAPKASGATGDLSQIYKICEKVRLEQFHEIFAGQLFYEVAHFELQQGGGRGARAESGALDDFVNLRLLRCDRLVNQQ
jgi:hypothetical protein